MGKGLTLVIEKIGTANADCDYKVSESLVPKDQTPLFFMRVIVSSNNILCAADAEYKSIFCTISFDEYANTWTTPHIVNERIYKTINYSVFVLSLWKLCSALKQGIFPTRIEHIN